MWEKKTDKGEGRGLIVGKMGRIMDGEKGEGYGRRGRDG